MVCLLFALWIQVLVIYGSLWFTIFLSSYDHCATSISGHANWYWGYDTSFQIFLKGLPYWFFEVEKHKNGVTSGFRDYSLFKVDVGGGARYPWEYSIVFKYCFGKMLQEPILEPFNVLFCWEKRRVFGCLGSWSPPLSDLGWLLILGVCLLYWFVIFTWVDNVAAGFGILLRSLLPSNPLSDLIELGEKKNTVPKKKKKF